jgi:hypothetical protein
MRLGGERIALRPACLAAVSIALFGGATGAVASGSVARARTGAGSAAAAAYKRHCPSSRTTRKRSGSRAVRSAQSITLGTGWSAAWAWGWAWKSGPDFNGSSEHAIKGPRRCTAAKHKTSAGHGISTSTPTTGPATTAPTGSGTPSAPGETTTPAGEAPISPGESPASPPVVTHIQVTSVEYHYTLSKTTVPAGKVAFDFVNDGQDEHNLNVLSG